MGKSLLDSLEMTSKAKKKVTGQWNALSAEQQRLVCRMVGIACLFIGGMAFIVFVRSLV